jgi:hypothetical protein
VGTPAYKLQSKTRRRACICALPCALWLWTLPPGRGRLWCCHVPHGSGPRLPTQEGSDAAMCHIASDPASLLKRAPVLPRAPRLRTLPPCLEGLRFYHVFHNPQRVVSLKNKERLSCNGLQHCSGVSKTCPCITKAPVRRAGRRCYHTSIPCGHVL